jgi:uncharacterized membrane protein
MLVYQRVWSFGGPYRFPVFCAIVALGGVPITLQFSCASLTKVLLQYYSGFQQFWPWLVYLMSSPASLSGPIPFSHRVTAPPLIPVHLGSQHRTASLIFIIFMQSATDRSTQIFCSVMFSLYCMHVTDHPIHKTLERLKTRPSHIDIFLTSSWHQASSH